MRVFQRFLSIVLVIALCFGLIPYASADVVSNVLKEVADKVFIKSGKMSYSELEQQRDRVNGIYKGLSIYNDIGNSLLSSASGGSKVRDHLGLCEIRWHVNLGGWTLYDTDNNRWWCEIKGGAYPWAPADDDHPAPSGSSGGAASTSTTALDSAGNTWVPVPYITRSVQMTSLDRLSAKRDALLAEGVYTGVRISELIIGGVNYYVLTRTTSSNVLAYTDYKGNAFCAPIEEKSTVTNIKFDYNKVESDNGSVSINGDNLGDINTGDQSTQILDFMGSSFTGLKVDDLSVDLGGFHYHNEHLIEAIWNGDLNQYEVTTGDIIYNNDNRTFNTVNNYYHITYNITNTYVNYIGSSAEFTPTAYELYYELPDGRSSADLTADEVAALSFQFYDCLNYERSATDSNMRALYHFDGDLSDSSYFSDKSSVAWKQGGSITYMDSSTFDGALYLDERTHELEIDLPSSIRGGSDFTLQFRHYQASQPDTQDNQENFLSLGGVTLMSWDERYLYSPNSYDYACQLPIGNWSELAVIRSNGVIRLYVNGVKVALYSNNDAFARQLIFHLGNTSRAYTMLDELRVLDFAIADGGANYTPTSVPYDSNLVLVLPGEGEVTSTWFEFFEDAEQVVKNADFTADGFSFTSYPDGLQSLLGRWCFWPSSSVSPRSAVADNGFVSLYGGTSSNSYQTLNVMYGFYCLVGYSGSSGAWNISGFEHLSSGTNTSANKTFVVVLSDGTLCTLTFNTRIGFSKSFDWGKLEYRYDTSGLNYRAALYITPAAGQTVEVAYAGLVDGSDWSFGWNYTQHTTSIDLSSLQANTAAVQTDIPITGYTVGGVRPTFPERGNVWFGVTSGRISSVQVYTGSAWTSANARWWTGSRWIPIYAFDIFTLADCWDIADGDDLITPITTETEGWNWWKGAWNDFRNWLGGVFSGPGQGPAEPSPSTPVTTTFTLLGSDQTSVFKNSGISTNKSSWGAGLNLKMGTSNYFTVHYSELSQFSSSPCYWPDGYSVGHYGDGSSERFEFAGNLGGGVKGRTHNSIEFTTKNPATVTVWSYISGVDTKGPGYINVQDTSFNSLGLGSGNSVAVDTFDLVDPGTFYLGSMTRPRYIYKVEVVEYGPHLIDTPPVDTSQDHYLSTHVLLGSHQSTNQVLLDRIADLTAQGRKADLQHNASTSGYVAWGSGVKAPMGTGNYFTVIYGSKSKVDYASQKNWSDGFSAGPDFPRFNFGAQLDDDYENHIRFTTTGPCVVKLWWVPADNNRVLIVTDSHLHALAVTPKEDAKKNEPLFSVLQVSEPGTLLLGGSGASNYIYKVEVVEVVYRDPPPTIGTNPGDNYDDGEPDILDDPLQDDDGQDVSIFSIAGWLAKGLWRLVGGLFGTVLGGITGAFKLISEGTGGFFDAFNDDLNPYSFSTYGGSDIWE